MLQATLQCAESPVNLQATGHNDSPGCFMQDRCEVLAERAATLQQEIDHYSQGERHLQIAVASLRQQLVAFPGYNQVCDSPMTAIR